MDSFLPTDKKASPLNEEEQAAAFADLYTPTKFRKVNRKWMDPAKPGEPRFALFSFAKSAGATPDKDGFFGVAKIRGVFYSEEDASARAEEIIRDVDSTNSIFTALCGQPFPIVDRGFSSELSEIDLSNTTDKIISDNVKAKRKAEEREMKAIEERRQALMNEDGTIKDSKTPEDAYIEKRVKLAHLRYNIKEHREKAIQCEELVKDTVKDLLEAKSEHPEYEENYINKYQQARRKANIPEETDFSGFMTFFCDPIEDDPDEKKS